jgi:hypothetical protein
MIVLHVADLGAIKIKENKGQLVAKLNQAKGWVKLTQVVGNGEELEIDLRVACIIKIDHNKE